MRGIVRFVINRLKGIRYAATGAWHLIRTEASIQAQAVIALIMTWAGFYFELTKTEWILQLLTIGLVMAIEGLNSAVEKMADFVHPDHHPKIGIIKDIAAGAVFIAALIAVIVGLLIYLPRFTG
ncbi:diacylglycerol kinase [Aureitalea marina]|uniref:Diacylglycerol kinase n=1 Tax=Aureitalea marina TaxID=930804 RepID=A0A2S7KND0_9FLAO|nr:diacylglycerol kinase family protein [Aureitalea marina]PQB04136.1 diacylglycerol kinase [Aureitalea marina]